MKAINFDGCKDWVVFTPEQLKQWMEAPPLHRDKKRSRRWIPPSERHAGAQ
jgi:hypothetical protein